MGRCTSSREPRGLLLALLAVLTSAQCARAPVAPARIVLVSIDTCRLDHLSVYGYARPTTPFLEELARRGVTFEHAISQVPDTTPSHASLLTGRWPFVHGAANGVPLRAEFTTLAEMLRDHGLRTAAFVSGWTMTARDSGLDQGFEVYDDALNHVGTPIARQPNERRAADTTDRALAWIADHADEGFFLFVHYFDPHGLYAPPAGYERMFEPTTRGGRSLPAASIPPYARLGDETDLDVYVARYDGEIRYVDDQLRRLAEGLKRHGGLDDTLVVVTADHGEGLGERGIVFHHGWDLFDSAIRVPLIVSWPGGLPRGTRVRGVAQLIDILPTVTELFGLPPPPAIDGRSLVPRIAGGDDGPGSFAVSKTTKNLTYVNIAVERGHRDAFAVRTLDWKYVRAEDGSRQTLFDLTQDPGESHDVAPAEPARLDDLRNRLREVLDGARTGDSGAVEPLGEAERKRLEEQLRALGYVR